MKLINVLIFTIVIFFGIASFLKLSLMESFIFGLTIILLIQGMLACLAMLYSFLKPENLQEVLPPRILYGGGYFRYSLIVPAKNEEAVIRDTIKAMAKINYPKHLYEVLVVVRNDDLGTIKAVEKEISSLAFAMTDRQEAMTDKVNIRLVKIDGVIANKAYSLNMGWRCAQGDIIAVFDAEDEPHPDILKSVDEIFLQKKVDIVQAGVQLINVSSNWFSCLNCLEYYFWFKSILPFMSKLGATPLGGNTVFFKRKVLVKIRGWDENCLTEDADIGIRASAAGFKTSMIYVEEMATLEEAPADEWQFIRQRTRWDQGYLQIILKGDWLKLGNLKHQFLSFYLLIQPIIHQFSILGMLSIPLISLGLKVPLWLAMFSWLPFYFLLIQFGLYFIGLADLKKYYRLTFSPLLFIYLFIFFVPYQLILAFSSLRAGFRLFLGVFNWEKTEHFNIHRTVVTQ